MTSPAADSHSVADDEIVMFRSAVERLAEKALSPLHARWEDEGAIDRASWRLAGEQGLLCPDLPMEEGGPGGNFLHSATVIEVLAAAGLSGPCYTFMLHSDIVAPYIRRLGSPAQRRRWLPAMAAGEAIGAIAMTEPGAGSDLKAVRTTAQRRPDGSYLINGAKTFITNGGVADVIVVVAKTAPELGAKGVSLFLVDAATPGLRRGRNLVKLGMKACNTAELFFDDMVVPTDALLGEPNQGFRYLMQELPRERLVIAIAALAGAEGALRQTIAYAKQRELFGKPLAAMQNTAFRLAELHSELVVARTFLDGCVRKQAAQRLDSETAAIAKLHLSELLGRVVDACLQLHGGYGYMWEQPIARAYADARVLRIFGGSNEVMKDLIGRRILA